jgi:hypothetical protein
LRLRLRIGTRLRAGTGKQGLPGRPGRQKGEGKPVSLALLDERGMVGVEGTKVLAAEAPPA